MPMATSDSESLSPLPALEKGFWDMRLSIPPGHIIDESAMSYRRGLGDEPFVIRRQCGAVNDGPSMVN